MYAMIGRRLAIGLVSLFIVSVLIFLGTNVLPGDAAALRLGQEATPETLAALREELGLNRALIVQYGDWFFGLLRGDLGHSLSSGIPVVELIGDRYVNTLIVAGLTTCIAVPLSLALGIVAAMYPGCLFDRVLTLFITSMVALPDFLVAAILVLLTVFAWQAVFGWQLTSPVVIGNISAMGPLELAGHFALPVTVLSLAVSAQIARMTRAAILNVMSMPYVEMAILKGIPPVRLVLRHALPNALGPIINIVALVMAYLMSGVVVAEVFFGYQGLAALTVKGVQARDFVLVQSLTMIFCGLYVVLLLLADIAAILSNPRLRHPR